MRADPDIRLDQATCLQRYWPLVGCFYLGAMLISACFGYVILKGGSPIKITTYGPTVYAIPAIVWAGVQFFASALGLYGSLSSSQYSRCALAIAGTVSAIIYAFFGVFGMEAPDGILLYTGCLFLMLPAACFSIVCAIGGANVRW